MKAQDKVTRELSTMQEAIVRIKGIKSLHRIQKDASFDHKNDDDGLYSDTFEDESKIKPSEDDSVVDEEIKEDVEDVSEDIDASEREHSFDKSKLSLDKNITSTATNKRYKDSSAQHTRFSPVDLSLERM